jgi:hypothetical protein
MAGLKARRLQRPSVVVVATEARARLCPELMDRVFLQRERRDLGIEMSPAPLTI